MTCPALSLKARSRLRGLVPTSLATGTRVARVQSSPYICSRYRGKRTPSSNTLGVFVDDAPAVIGIIIVLFAVSG